MLRLAQFFLYIPIKLTYPSKVVGKEVIKTLKNKPAIFAMNHTSNLDAVLLAVNTWEKKYYLAKKELFKNKVFGSFLKGVGAVKIDRSTSDVTAIKNVLKLLKNNKKVVIFPEGTRNNNENMELGEVKHGTAMFAIKAKVPIVPIFISRKPKAYHKTIISIGQPFELSEFYGKKLEGTLLDQAGEIIAQKIEETKNNYQQTLIKKKKKKKVK